MKGEHGGVGGKEQQRPETAPEGDLMKKGFLLIFCFVFLLLPVIPQRVVDLKTMRGQPITVTIEGAVLQPQTLTCAPYTQLGEVLAQVELAEDADLTPFSMTMTLKDNDVIRIPQLQRSGSEISAAKT